MCLGEVCAVSPTRSRFPDYGPDLDFLPNIGPEKVCFFPKSLDLSNMGLLAESATLCARFGHTVIISTHNTISPPTVTTTTKGPESPTQHPGGPVVPEGTTPAGEEAVVGAPPAGAKRKSSAGKGPGGKSGRCMHACTSRILPTATLAPEGSAQQGPTDSLRVLVPLSPCLQETGPRRRLRLRSHQGRSLGQGPGLLPDPGGRRRLSTQRKRTR